MGLIRFAVRQCAAMALRNMTLAEDRVFLSLIDPISTKIQESRAPMLIVNTDDHRIEADGRDMTGGEHRLDIVIEAVIAARVVTDGKDGAGQSVTVNIIEADSGLDLTLDILEHQITRALLSDKSWAVLFRRFVMSVSSRLSRRGADASGVRWAARQITITCDTLAEPVGGESLAPGSVWGDFVAALEGDATLSPIAPLIRGVIDGDAREWARGAAMLNISQDMAVEAGFGPLVTTPQGEPVLVQDVLLVEDQA